MAKKISEVRTKAGTLFEFYDDGQAVETDRDSGRRSVYDSETAKQLIDNDNFWFSKLGLDKKQ